MHVNTLYAPLLNQDGSNFGETRISFPATEIADVEKFASKLPESNLKDQLLAGSEYCRLKFEETEPATWGESQDLWSQERSATANSLAHAIEWYFAED